MTLAETSRLIRRLIALNMTNTLAYRGDFVFYMLSAILTPVVSLLVWRAAIASGAQLPVSETYLTSYFVLLAVVGMLTSSWLSMFLADTIRNGRLSVWLARPGSHLYEMAANNLAEKAFKLVVLLPMVLTFGFIFREDVSLAAPAWRWGVLAISVVMGACITFSIDVVEGSLAFWIEDVSGLVRVRSLLGMVLGGYLIPLAVMPEWSRGFMEIQPFRYILSFPLEVIVGDLTRADIATGLALQAIYTALFVLGARRLWSRGKFSYAATGA